MMRERSIPTGYPHILLLDPLDDERALYDESFRASGWRVEPHTDFDDAIAASYIVRPDAAIVRFRLGNERRNGADFIRALHATMPGIPVVIISTSIDPVDRRAAEAAGCAEFVLLPMTPDRLMACVRRALSARKEDPRTRRP